MATYAQSGYSNRRSTHISRRRFVAAFGALLAAQHAPAATESSPLPIRFDAARDPGHDLDTASKMARATRRRVLAEIEPVAETELAGEFLLKGFPKPVLAYRVLRVNQAPGSDGP